MKLFLTMARVLVAAVAFAFGSTMVSAQPLPTTAVEEVMVKTSLLTLNDANLTGNYDVLHAKMAKAFRDKFDAEVLKQAFNSFAGHHIDMIAAKPIVSTSEAKIDSDGCCAAFSSGFFDTTPSLNFAVSEGECKLINTDVEVRAPSISELAGGRAVPGLALRITEGAANA